MNWPNNRGLYGRQCSPCDALACNSLIQDEPPVQLIALVHECSYRRKVTCGPPLVQNSPRLWPRCGCGAAKNECAIPQNPSCPARLRLITQRRRNPPSFIKQPINEPSSIDQNIIENGKGSRISVRTAIPGATAAEGNEREEQNSNKIVHSARAGKVKSQTPKVEKQGAYHRKFFR